MSETFPDIEIYVRGIDAAAALAWVASVLGEPLAGPRGNAHVQRVRHCHDGRPLEVLVVTAAHDGFTSICFDSADTPWPDDLACARDASRWFRREVRCSAGSWHAAMGESDDGWLRVTDGEVSAIVWR